MEYIETWIRYRCPDCRSINWICAREDDDTIPGVDAIRCHNCKKCHWIELAAVDPAWIECCYGENTDIEDVHVGSNPASPTKKPCSYSYSWSLRRSALA